MWSGSTFPSNATGGQLQTMRTYSRCPCLNRASVSGFQRCFVATTGSRAPAASAVMLAAAVTAGVPSSAVRVPSAEILPAAVEGLRRMPAASHVEAARTPGANGPGSVPATRQMEATRVRWFSG
jgi:hypothetical protein